MVRSLLRIKLSCIGSSLVDSYLLKFNSFKKINNRNYRNFKEQLFSQSTSRGCFVEIPMFNPFQPNVSFQYPLKISENQKVRKTLNVHLLHTQHIFDQCYYFVPHENTRKERFLDVYRGYEMETLARNGLRKTFMLTDNFARQKFHAMFFFQNYKNILQFNLLQ